MRGKVVKIQRRNWQFKYSDGFRSNYQSDIALLGNICSMCGLPATIDNPLQRHHVIPKAKGGPDILANYKLVHKSCHQRLHPNNKYFK